MSDLLAVLGLVTAAGVMLWVLDCFICLLERLREIKPCEPENGDDDD